MVHSKTLSSDNVLIQRMRICNWDIFSAWIDTGWKLKKNYINFSLLHHIKLASMRQNVTCIISIIYLALIYYCVVEKGRIFKRSHTMSGACSVPHVWSFHHSQFSEGWIFVHLYTCISYHKKKMFLLFKECYKESYTSITYVWAFWIYAF